MENCVLIIFGVTNAGEKFRPSDWIERFCGVMAPYDTTYHSSGERVNSQKGMGYSDLVFPTTHKGERVVIAMEQLHDIEPLAWEFVLNFIKENDLKTDKISYSEIFSKDAIKK